MADLTVITLSRNLGHWRRLSESLAAATKPCDVAALLVNNDRRAVDMTAEALAAGWMVVEPGTNTSFSLGNNLGAKATQSDWLLLLNDDVILEPDFLQEMWAGRRADICGALLLHSDGTVNHAGTLIAPDGRTDHIGRHVSPLQLGGGYAFVPAVTFAAVMIHRAIWDALGGLDESYFYGWEDTDFCLRALQAGYTIACNRDAVAFHDECGTRPRNSQQDVDNCRLFINRWRDCIPQLLTSYGSRIHPNTVENPA